MILNNINLNYLRVFECVYRTRCMTVAAKELHLTQSGVSQHIRSLEESIEKPLFDRLHRKLMPTKEAQKLYFQTRLALKHLEQVIGEISDIKVELTGEIQIGMPVEFGHHIIIPALAELGKKYPDLHFQIQLGFTSLIQRQLLDAHLDFAFVDEFVANKNIETQKVTEETFELCASLDYLKKYSPPKNRKSYFETLQYIAYQKGEPILRKWFLHHTKRRNLNLNVRARVMDVQAVAKLISQGLGVGVLPGHWLANLKEQGFAIHNFEGCGLPLKNKINLAYLKGRRLSPVVKLVMEELKSMVGEG